MHKTSEMKRWKQILSKTDKYFERYEGYISSHDYKRADDNKLAKLAEKIKKAIN